MTVTKCDACGGVWEFPGHEPDGFECVQQQRDSWRARAERAERQAADLVIALEQVAEDPELAGVQAPLCWCGAWDSAPQDHSPECISANLAIAAYRGGKEQ